MKNIKISGYKFAYRNFREWFSIYKDIFILREYKFSSSTDNPFIIDCGSHIGISVLYFKKIFPRSKIIAFEANPLTFKFLKKNITQNKLEQVAVYNNAVGKKKEEINFYIGDNKKGTWNWGDSAVKNAWYDPNIYKTIKVPALRLSTFINQQIDLLKLDIEGSELTILEEIEKKFPLINEIYIEFHGSNSNKKNSLPKIVNLLKKNGFNLTLRYPYTLFHPFKRELLLKDIPKKDPLFLIINVKRKME
jgi:FkbM family methyltransferase